MTDRNHAIRLATRRLQTESSPRLQMTLIVALTGGAGLLSSFVLLQMGMTSMALRYPVALCLAYGFFLFLIWLWLRTNAEDYQDLPLDALPVPDLPDLPRPPVFTGHGGQFGGGGATSGFDGPAGPAAEAASAPLRGMGDAASSAADADEVAVPLLAVALAVGIALASLYVVYIAPVLFAEVLVDGALSYALLRHLRGHDPQHWLATAVRRTWLPCVATAVFLSVVGMAMSAAAPGAKSVGQFVEQVTTTRSSR